MAGCLLDTLLDELNYGRTPSLAWAVEVTGGAETDPLFGAWDRATSAYAMWVTLGVCGHPDFAGANARWDARRRGATCERPDCAYETDLFTECPACAAAMRACYPRPPLAYAAFVAEFRRQREGAS